MKEKEEIKVFIRTEHGKTVCVCPRNSKRCLKKCYPEVVMRDKFDGWEKTFHRDRYGR